MILLSGTAISPGIVRDTAINATKALERHLHCQSRNSSEIALCLRQRHYSAILDPDRPVSFSIELAGRSVVVAYGRYMPMGKVNFGVHHVHTTDQRLMHGSSILDTGNLSSVSATTTAKNSCPLSMAMEE